MLGHMTEDLNEAAPKLAEEEFIVSELSCEHEEGIARPIIGSCFCGFAFIAIACPVCDSRYFNRLSLKAHIEEAHV